METALRSRTEIIAVLVSDSGTRHLPSLAALIPSAARILSTTDRLFAQISGTEAPQGIAALIRPRTRYIRRSGARDGPDRRSWPVCRIPATWARSYALPRLLAPRESPRAIAAGTGTANPFGPKALRASAGSALRLPILRGIAAPVLLAQLRIAGVRVYAACPDDVCSDSAATLQPHRASLSAPWDVDWRAPSALLMGNEGAGLPADLVRSADAAVRIPQASAG